MHLDMNDPYRYRKTKVDQPGWLCIKCNAITLYPDRHTRLCINRTWNALVNES